MMSAVQKQSQRSNFVVAIGTVLAGSALAIAAAPALASTTSIHTASSYGVRVKVGDTVKLGPIAPAVLPECETQAVTTNTASAASASLTPFLSTGAVSSVASSTATSSSAESTVAGVKLLGGLISADAVTAESTTSVDGGTFSFSDAGSEFANLSVLGLPVSANPAPNTKIDLPLIGYVVLNEQTSSVSSDRSVFTVNMVHIYVTLSNLLGYPVGTDIIVAQASSELKVIAGVAAVGGYAYAPELVAGPVTSGPIVSVPIPCDGTGGVVDTGTIASTSIAGVLSTGTITVTGEGNINHLGASAQATTTTASLDLLSSLVSATGIQATATGVTTNGTTFTFTAGSTFVGISVAGHPEITVNVAPNTKVAIPGLGTLYLNRVDKFADKIKATPLELVVTAANDLGLAIGAELTIGAAEAQLHSATIP